MPTRSILGIQINSAKFCLKFITVTKISQQKLWKNH